MISRYTSSGSREVFDIDGETLIAIHSEFCTGCQAIRGTCGSLTQAAVEAGRITDPVALDRLTDAKKYRAERLATSFGGLIG